MKLLHNEAHELGNGWGFYIDTDIDNHSYVHSNYFKYKYKNKNMNIIPGIPEISDEPLNKYNDNTEIDKTFVDIDVISVISLTFTCLLAFLIH